MPRRSQGVWVLACVMVGLTLACSSPAGPTRDNSTAATVGTFVGNLTVPGQAELGGLLLLTKSGTSPVASRSLSPRWLAAFVDFVQPTVYAQGAATGMLVTDGGPVVSLSGTFGGGMFHMTGGGYTIAASVTGTTITGTGSAPGGATAQVVAVPSPPPTIPTASAEGIYRTAFHIDAPFKFKNVRADNGDVFADCSFTLAIDGNLSLDFSKEGSNYTGFLQTTWSERNVLPGTGFGCPTTSPVSSFGPTGVEYSGPLDPMVFAYVDRGTSGPFSITRTHAFVGTFTGSAFQGRFSISFNMTGLAPGPPAVMHTSGYPSTSISVTLTK